MRQEYSAFLDGGSPEDGQRRPVQSETEKAAPKDECGQSEVAGPPVIRGGSTNSAV